MNKFTLEFDMMMDASNKYSHYNAMIIPLLRQKRINSYQSRLFRYQSDSFKTLKFFVVENN